MVAHPAAKFLHSALCGRVARRPDASLPLRLAHGALFGPALFCGRMLHIAFGESARMTDDNQGHSGISSYRESVIERQFLTDLLTEMWDEQVEVLRPDVDIFGYDLVLEARGSMRHLQLKSALRSIRENNRSVRGRLAAKPAGCVLWIVIDDHLKPKSYRWFGNGSGQKLDLSGFDRARDPKTKKERLDTYTVPSNRLVALEGGIKEVIEKLFGPKTAQP